MPATTPEARFEVPNLEALTRLTSEPLPLGLRAQPPRRTLHRDTYFDTPDGELRRRGITCRLRVRMDDRRFLALHVRDPRDAESGAGSHFLEAEILETDPLQALSGVSAPARRLQAVIDPGRLGSTFELAIDRHLRLARRGVLPLARFELAYDAISVRARDLTARFQELRIRQLRRSRVTLDRLARAFEDEQGLRRVRVDEMERAEMLLESLESEQLAHAVHANREATVLAAQEGRIALASHGTDLHLPVHQGSGEEACRDAMRTALGSAEGQVVLLGVVPATTTRPALEVWLARRLRKGLISDHRPNLEWYDPREVVARVGSPVLRDPKTLAALSVAARSEMLPEWSAALTEEGGAKNAASAPEEVVARSRQTLVGLQVPVLPDEALDTRRPRPEQFINMELSTLEFNARVLALAEDPGVPLLARVRFLAILSSNLDEFFMVRVAGLKHEVSHGITDTSADGLTPQEQFDAIAIRLRALVIKQYQCAANFFEHELPSRGVCIRSWHDLTEEEQARLRSYFDERVFPVLTPKAMTRAPGHPFPYIEDLSLNLAVMFRDTPDGPVHFAHLHVPDSLPRFVQRPDSNDFVLLEEIIKANIAVLYPGRQIEEVHPFRLTRRGDIDLDEKAAASFYQAIEEELRRRPTAPVVRIEVESSMPRPIRDLLQRELRFEESAGATGLGEADIYEVHGIVDLGSLHELASLPLPDLDYPRFTGAAPLETDRSIFQIIDERDVLVHHPYDHFEPTFERFVEEAADDPDVIAIKITLYRPGGPSATGDALYRAVDAGKDVSVFVELKARFDEERNILWAKHLQRAGIHVVTGLVKLKTHAKIALVVRRTDGKLRRYVHIGTGNYNASSAKLYTDFGLFTSDEAIAADLHTLFNELTGSSRAPRAEFHRLLVAPTNMRQRFTQLIDREIEHARAGGTGRIRAKMNAVADKKIIGALYRASQAGVNVDLIVRGICTLRPGVPGLSERIRVYSILGRFLEHGRIYCFENGGSPEYFIGSADWRPRNLNRRIEVVTPVQDPAACARLNQVLEAELNDPLAWELSSDGTYTQYPPPTGVELKSAQERLMELAAERNVRSKADEVAS